MRQGQGGAPSSGVSQADTRVGDTPFLTDVATLRKRAREHIDEGAVTSSYAMPAEQVVKVLNDALATEIVCVLRYRRHYYMAQGIHAESVKAEFLEHANEEQAHADRLAERIVQLASRSHAQYVEGRTLREMIVEDLVAERIAIDSYREIAQWLGDRDSTTRKMMEEILAAEEEHADDLVSLLAGMPKDG
jgi:bacterioferritin